MTDDGASYLPPGTLCVLHRCTDFPELNGRTCEIVGGPMAFPDGGDDPWYWYTARWAEAEFPGEALFALRRCLRPIAQGTGAPAERTINGTPAN